MAVYVDPLFTAAPPKNPQALNLHNKNNGQWCHMWADTDEELHTLAASIGMRRAWHQASPPHSLSHYDLTPSKRKRALAAGAIEGDIREALAKRRAK